MLMYQEDRTNPQFTISVGNIKINWSAFKTKRPNQPTDLVTLLSEDNESFTTKCEGAKANMVREGNLDLLREPHAYKNGFSEKYSIVTYKKGSECLHLNLLFVSRKDATVKEFGRDFLIDKIGRNGRPAGPGNEAWKAEDKQTVLMMVYEYRYWKDGKEIKFQPNINRFGTWGTYGDDEQPGAQKKPEEIMPGPQKKEEPAEKPVPIENIPIKPATNEDPFIKPPTKPVTEKNVPTDNKPMNGKEQQAQPFFVGSLKLQFNFNDDQSRAIISAISTDTKDLSYAKVSEPDLALVQDISELQYFPFPVNGASVPIGATVGIRQKAPLAKNAKYFAIKLIKAEKPFLVYQSKYWPDLVTEKKD